MPYTGPFPFTGSTNQILVSNTSLSGGVTNKGTVGAGGIVVVKSTLTSGGVVNEGVVAGGINVDSQSKISATGSAIAVLNTTTFGGGITNAGALSAGGIGIRVGGTTGSLVEITNFTGGLTNKGNISAGLSGIGVFNLDDGAGERRQARRGIAAQKIPADPEITPKLVMPPVNVGPVILIAVLLARMSLALSTTMPCRDAWIVPVSTIAPVIVVLFWI
jgi:hypothetical protein